MSDEQLLTRFELGTVTYWDGRANYLFDSQCTLTNQRLIVQAANGNMQQVLLRDIARVWQVGGLLWKSKTVRVEIGTRAALDLQCSNNEQVAWIRRALNEAMAGGFLTTGYGPSTSGPINQPISAVATTPTAFHNPPQARATNNSTTFGVLALLGAFCCWPVGLVFAIMSLNEAKRHNVQPTLAYIAFAFLALSLIVTAIILLSSMATTPGTY